MDEKIGGFEAGQVATATVGFLKNIHIQVWMAGSLG